MGDGISNVNEKTQKRLVIPSLVLSRLNMTPPRNVAGLLLVDIAVTFETTVGVMGQIRTLASAMALVFALLMGILSVRFKHKSLLVIGLALYGLSRAHRQCVGVSHNNFIIVMKQSEN